MPDGRAGGATIRLLEVDPDLGRDLPEPGLAEASAALAARAIELDPGPWDAGQALRGDEASAGVLVLEGLIAQDVSLTNATATELLGPGDFVHAAEVVLDQPFLSVRVGWTVLEPSLVALLDDRFERALARWPDVASALHARTAERTARLALLRAGAHVGRVEDRLLALMWHLAARHGRVGPGGVILPLGLRHRVLGDMVGASRSTVTLALGALERRGAVTRRLDGGWVLLEPLTDTPARKPRRTTPRARSRGSRPASTPTAPEVGLLRARVTSLRATYREQQAACEDLYRTSRGVRERSEALRRSLHDDA
jgi:CRP-like cAMP-binding protein